MTSRHNKQAITHSHFIRVSIIKQWGICYVIIRERNQEVKRKRDREVLSSNDEHHSASFKEVSLIIPVIQKFLNISFMVKE